MKLSISFLFALVGVALAYRDNDNLKIAAKLYQIAAGQGGVWGVTSGSAIYAANKYGNWKKVSGSLAQVDVCNTAYGVNDHDYIYMRNGVSSGRPLGTSWRRISGSLKHITCSDTGPIWGTNANDQIFFRNGADKTPGGTSWIRTGGRLAQISSGKIGCWGRTKHSTVYYRKGTYGGKHTKGTGWKKTGGRCLAMFAGKKALTCIGTNGRYYYRTGITRSQPHGKGWTAMGTKVYDYQEYSAIKSALF